QSGASAFASAPSGGGSQATMLAAAPVPEVQPVTAINTLSDVVAVLEQAGAIKLASEVYLYVHLVKLGENVLEFRPHDNAPEKLAQELSQGLKIATGNRWMVSVSSKPGAMTLSEHAQAREQENIERVKATPLVAEIFRLFPDAQV